MDIKEYQLFSSPVWSVQNTLTDNELDQLAEFAYGAVKQWPLDTPVSKRNGMNSQPINFNNPLLMKVLSHSISVIKEIYDPVVELRLEKYWININPPGAYNIRHTHPRTVLACTLYINTPENCGDIVFYNPNPAACFATYSNKLEPYNFTEYRIKPTPGLFVAFPGWLDHSVDINTGTSDRISISMNVVTRD